MKQLNIARKTLNKILIHRIIHGKYGTKAIAVIILMIIAFAFIHSEFNMFNFDEDNHGTHDYCTIVNGSTIPTTKTNTSDLTKVKSVIVIISKFIEVEDPNSSTFFSETDNPHYTKKTNKVYLDNNTFLI